MPKVRSNILALLSLVALTVLTACSTPQNTFAPNSDVADSVITIYVIVVTAASLVGAAVLAALIFVLFKFRAREGHKARQIHGNNKLELAWTIAPIFVLLVISIPTMFFIAGTAADPEPDALHVEAIGHQWWFEFRYPGMGPDGSDLVTANELHVPLGRQVAITLKSDDVIHSFWVPKLVGKTDMVPSRTNKLAPFTPNETGEFYGQCAEFCGLAHAQMRFRVFVDTTSDFEAFTAGLAAGVVEPEADSAAERGRNAFALSCGACHTVEGLTSGVIGPDLTLFGERTTVAAGILPSTDANLRAWITEPTAVKPGALMPALGLPDGTINEIIAFLKSQTVD